MENIPGKEKGAGSDMKQALIAMSGGVDSSVAALLMQQQGYTCIGVTMKLFEKEGFVSNSTRPCGSPDDIADARRVAQRLGMTHEVLRFQGEFEKQVIGQFVHAYECGFTPNPCINCNRYLKFAKLFAYMQQCHMDVIVTGHYARVAYEKESRRWLLKKGLDHQKDQSYFLYNLTQQQLKHVRLPIGELSKAQVREIAQTNGFVNAEKPDSQDICFVPDGDYAAFIARYTGKLPQPGAFLNTDGDVIGTHRGIVHYTIGQRRGLGISAPQPLYVCRIDPVENTVTLGTNDALYSRTLMAKDVNLIACETLSEPTRVEAKIRYRHVQQPATAWQTEDGTLHVEFDEPQRAITCGQAVVLYDGEVVIGGGTIKQVG